MILVDSEEKISFAHNGLILLDVFWIQTIPNQETILANIHIDESKMGFISTKYRNPKI